ncbi:hypothetical protein AB0M36_05975 [Actinoplanes sp. NPDC051346]|uniref:hypothetical protein n=1 Tax=Actinoplanes sp. NPDC051346 TaxID=3155048 RepID=UPI003437CCD3
MGFEVTNQHANTINMVEGQQNNIIGAHGNVTIAQEVQPELRELRAVIEGLRNLPSGASTAAVRELDGAEAAVSRPTPDREEFAERLGRLSTVLVRAGALATAGQSLSGPLIELARKLGHLGQPILRALGM